MGNKKSKGSTKQSKVKELVSRTEKPWGHEELLFDRDGLGLKRIVIKPKQQTSFHYHNEKNEIFFVESGKAVVRFESGKKEAKKGEFVYVPKLTTHETYNPGPGKLSLIEFNSPQSDTDVVRVNDPYSKIRAQVERVTGETQKKTFRQEAPSAVISITKKNAVFLDRDGVINQDDPNYIKSWSEFHFLPKVKSAIRQLNNSGYYVVVITNQGGVAKGLYTEETVKEINRKMQAELELAGAHIDAVYFCPHTKEQACNCRKPNPGMIDRAVKEFNIDLAGSWIVGDSLKHDIPLGKSLGLKTIFVKGSRVLSIEDILESQPDYVVEDLMAAVQIIKGSVFGEQK